MADNVLILASTSKSRQAILRNAGLNFDIVDAGVDEDIIKDALLCKDQSLDLADIATILAQTKAVSVSEKFPDKWTIGADQVLICDGELFNKPRSLDEARDHLLRLSGKTHVLETAIACARQGKTIWSHRDCVHLSMRAFSARFLGRYMAAAGSDVMSTVGGYKLEQTGIQLFEKIEGDYFTILGMPLLPLLDFLRRQELLEG